MGAGANKGDEIRKFQKIRAKIMKIKHQIPIKMQKIKVEALLEERRLLAEFKKTKLFRSPTAQMHIAHFITHKHNLMKIYQIIKRQIQKLVGYITNITNLQFVKTSTYPSFKVILYSQSILKDPIIDQFCKSIKKRCPGITEAVDDDINCQIMKFHKKSEFPSPTMTNNYLLSLIWQEKLDFEEVNMGGKHNIQYGL